MPLQDAEAAANDKKVIDMRARVGSGLLTLLLIGMATVVQAQPVITSPSSGQVFKAGPDFASDVLQDAWDFSNYEDLSPSPDEFGGWATNPPNLWNATGTGPAFINTGVGRFVGQAAGDNQLMLLHRGDAIGLNPGRNGLSHPIDTSKYRKLAVKMRVTGAPANQVLVAYWYHDSYAAPNYLNRAGGIIMPTAIPGGNSEQVYVFDLTQAGSGGSQLVPACGGAGCTGAPAPWANEAVVRGFRLDPASSFASQGIEIDWVRLTASNNQAAAALMTVNLNSCSSFSHLSVTDGGGVAYSVTDSTGNNSQRTFNYGIFPPGTYTLRAVCANGTSGGTSFRVNTPPMVTVIDPDVTGSPATDYAATHRGGDRWDFEQATDVVYSENISVTAGVCASGGCGLIPSDRPGAAPGSRMLRASSVGNTPSQVGDPALEFLNGSIPPLSGRRHELLTFSLRVLRPYDVALGSVLRVLWGSQSFADHSVVTQTQDMRVWPGFHTYTLDLSSLTAQNGGIETECVPNCPTTPWPARSIRHFRIDPHEFGDTPTGFDIDDVSLTAPDEVALGQQFAVRYRFADPDTAGSSYTARVYIETWPQRTGRALLHTANNVSPNADLVYQFNPQVSAVPPGRFSIYVEVTETQGGVQQVSGNYATGPIVVYSPTGTSPQLSVASPSVGQLVSFPFNMNGCAFDQGANTGGINTDDVAVYAVAGPGVVGVAPGTTYALGFGNGLGTLQYGPVTGSPVTCESVTNPASPYRNSGFRISNIGLQQGPWTLKTFARSTLTGELSALGDIPVQVTQMTLAPQNFQATSSGNTVTISFQAPVGGPPIGGYAVDGATNPGFNPGAFTVVVGAAGTYSGVLGNGTWYLRIRSLAPNGAPGMASETRSVTLGPAPPAPPGVPTLSMAQVSANPVTLRWSAGAGGTPTSYTLYAGTSPGASNLAVAPMGLATSITAVAPLGTPIYVRVVATNAAGSATSNEVAFSVAPDVLPGPPTLSPPTVHGSNVTLSWAPPTNAASAPPSAYMVYARLPGSPAVVATLPVSGTSVTVPASPGTYLVSVVAVSAAGTSPESNQVTVVVP